jgi:hypothetical protein
LAARSHFGFWILGFGFGPRLDGKVRVSLWQKSKIHNPDPGPPRRSFRSVAWQLVLILDSGLDFGFGPRLDGKHRVSLWQKSKIQNPKSKIDYRQ